LEKMFRAGFEDRKVPNEVISVILAGPDPTLLRITALGFDDFIRYRLPSALGKLWIASGEIGAGDLAVDDGLLLRFVVSVQQPQCGRLVVGFETFPFAGLAVKEIKDAGVAAIDSVSLVHEFVHERNDDAIRKRP